MDLFVVFDSKGGGRLVGVFDSEEKAERVIQVDPYYYTRYKCALNSIHPNVLLWVQTEDQRTRLKALTSELSNEE